MCYTTELLKHLAWLMAAIAPITRCRLPMHNSLSSFWFACVVHLFLIASSGLHQLVVASKHFAVLTTSFKVTLVCDTSRCLCPLPISLKRSVSDTKPAMNWSLMRSSAKFSYSHCLPWLLTRFPRSDGLASVLNEAEKFLLFARNPDTSAIKFFQHSHN